MILAASLLERRWPGHKSSGSCGQSGPQAPAVCQGRDAPADRAHPLLRRQAYQGRARRSTPRSAKSAASVTHTLSPLHPYLTQVELDCGPKLKVSQGDRRHARPVPCDFTTKDDKLSITLDKAYGPGDTIDLAIEYSGSPDRGLYFRRARDRAYPEKPLSFWTQGESEDTHHWLPCYDYPNERATTEMIITVEKPLFVLSNGLLVETKDNDGGTTTYHWKMDVPHVSYLISLAVGDFAVYHDRVGDLPLDYYVAKHVDEATARRFMGKTPR